MDKRIVKTKNNISNALLKLIEMKSAREITVKEIAELAEIERKTFYLHYNCIEDVYKDIENNINEQLIAEANKYIKSNYKITDIFNNLNKVIMNNIVFFKSVSKNDSYSFLLHSFENILSNIIYKIARENYNIKSNNLKFYTDFYAAGIVKLYTSWLKDETNLTLDELTIIVTRACFLSVDELSKE